MAAIGLKYPMFAAITTYTEGSSITYGTGLQLGPAISANITLNHRDTQLYGDDVMQECDKGLTDYSISLNVTHLTPAMRVALLGDTEVKSSNTVDHYEVNDANAPYGGFGFIRVLMEGGVKKYEGYLFKRVQFTQDSVESSTKEKEITFGTPQLTGTGYGVVTDSTGTIHHYDYMQFTSEASALTWLKAKLNVT